MSFASPADRAPPPPPPPPRRGWGSWIKLLLVLATVLFVGLILATPFILLVAPTREKVEEEHHSLTRGAANKIAIITLEGAILEGDGFVKKQIDAVRADKKVKAIVLRVNSPGGTVSGSDFIHHHLTKLRQDRELPIVVSMGSIAASGGYYVAMAAGKEEGIIFAEPTTWTGSIGVIIPHYDVSQLMARWDIKDDSIKSHELKQMGSPTRAMSEKERELLKGLVDTSFDRFKEIVQAGRPKLTKAQIEEVATGEVFATPKAIEKGLVDQAGFIDDAIDRARTLAKLEVADTEVVKYKAPFSLFGGLLGMQQQARSSDLQRLVELTAPRAYYLFTWLPTLE